MHAIIPFEPFSPRTLYGLHVRYIDTLNLIWNRLDHFFPLSNAIERYKGQRRVRISVTDEHVLPRLASTYNPRLGNQSLVNARFRYIQAPAAKCLLDFLESDLKIDKPSAIADVASVPYNSAPPRRTQYTTQDLEPLMELGIRIKDDKITVYDINDPSRFGYGA